MKKLIAALLILASAVSFASCSVKKKDLTYEERQASLAARESEKVAESLRVESEIVEERKTLEDEIGKTIKGERLVLMRETSSSYDYVVYEFNKSGYPKSRLDYQFFRDATSYNDIKNNGDVGKYKMIDHDDEKRIVVYKRTDLPELNFDELYKNFSENGRYDIVE